MPIFSVLHKMTATPQNIKRNIFWGSTPKNIEKAVLQKKNITVVTPTVAGIARGLFVQSLRIAGDPHCDDDGISQSHHNDHVHETDPSTIEWVSSSRNAPDHYRSVVVDGVTYSVRIDSHQSSA